MKNILLIILLSLALVSAGQDRALILPSGSSVPSWVDVATIGGGTLSSVGLSVGTTGTNINVSGSPLTSDGTITLNVPDASATARGAVTTGTQTLAGAKTFSSAPTFSTMTAGSVLFAGTSGLLSQDATNLYWDDATDRLGIGANAGSLGTEASITTIRSFNGLYPVIWGVNTSGGNAAAAVVRAANNNGNVFDMRVYGGGHSTLANVSMQLATGAGGLYLATESTQTIFVANGTGANILARFTNTGVGIAGVTTPSARLHLPAGTATAGTAPLKFTTGTALTTPADGAMEYHSSHLYFTIGSTRYQLDQQGGGGITNSAINTELMKSDGTNAIGSDIIIPSTANVNIGKGTTSGTSRIVSATGSGANIKLDLRGQGTGGVQLVPDSAASATDLTIFSKVSAGGGSYAHETYVDEDPSGGAILMFSYRNTFSNDDIYQLQFSADSIGISGGTLLGGTTSKPFVLSGQVAVSTKPASDLVLHGGDSGVASTTAASTYIRGGTNTGATSTGGNLVLSPGEGTSANGYIIIQNLPTSSAGLPSGAVYWNSNVLTRVP